MITDLDGKKIAVAGSGRKDSRTALRQGPLHDPQGMALDGDTLYVADRKNHALRALNLKDMPSRPSPAPASKTMGAGGRRPRASRPPQQPLGPAAAQRQDLHRHGRASSDLDLRSRPGPGRSLRGQPPGKHHRRPPRPWPRSPSPAAWPPTARHLFVADAETSSIRCLPLSGPGVVKPLSARASSISATRSAPATPFACNTRSA